jgi:hypothetical protein
MSLKVILAVFASCEEVAPSLLSEQIDLSGISENPRSGHHKVSARPGPPGLRRAGCALDPPEAGTRLKAGVVDAGACRCHILREGRVSALSAPRLAVVRPRGRHRCELAALPAQSVRRSPGRIIDSLTDSVILRTAGHRERRSVDCPRPAGLEYVGAIAPAPVSAGGIRADWSGGRHVPAIAEAAKSANGGSTAVADALTMQAP